MDNIQSITHSIASYVQSNDKASREFISQNIYTIVKHAKKASTGYRFWKFSSSKILDLIMGYGIVVNPSNFLSYYGYINRTPTIFNALNEKGLFGVIENGVKSSDVFYNITALLKEHGDEEVLSIVDKYKEECELFRILVEEYTLKIDTNIKFLIVKDEVLRGVYFPNRLANSFVEGYKIIDVSNPNTRATLKASMANLYKNKKTFLAMGIDYFNSIPKKKKIVREPEYVSEYLDILTPAGNNIFTVKITK